MQVLKKCLWSLILNNLFYDLIHVYSPGAGADSPQGTKFGCQQKGIITLPICCKFQRNLLWSLILYIFFHDLIHVYSPRAWGIQPPGDKVSMSTETSCHFGHLLLVSNRFRKIHCFTFFPYKSIRDQIWPCRKIGRGQPRVIIYINFVELESPMLHAKFQDHRTSGSGEEDF